MEQIENILLKLVEMALGKHWKYFEVTPADILVNEDNVYSQMFLFKPIDPKSEDSKLVGESHHLEIMAEDYDNDEDVEVSLIVGEDTQIPLTMQNIYIQLYWCEVLEPI